MSNEIGNLEQSPSENACETSPTNQCLHVLVNIGQISMTFFGAITVPLALLASYLIIKHSAKEMRSYKYFMLVVTVTQSLVAHY